LPNEGYIKVYRSTVNNPIYTQPPLYLRVFERLIMEANYKCARIPFNGGTKLVKRGEKITSIRQIAEWVGWYERGIFKVSNPKTISEILNWLIENKMIELLDRGNAQVTHYNIVNYCIYQSSDSTEVTVDGAVSIQWLDTNKKGNKVKKVKKVTTIPPIPPQKSSYGESKNITLLAVEFEKLNTEFGADKTKRAIEFLSSYKIEKPNYKTASDYLTMRRWVFKAIEKDEKDKPQKTDYSNPDRYKNAESEDDAFG